MPLVRRWQIYRYLKRYKIMNDTLPVHGVSSLNQVKELSGLSRSTIYREVEAGTFPAPIKLSERRIAWRNADLIAWVEGLEAANLSQEA